MAGPCYSASPALGCGLELRAVPRRFRAGQIGNIGNIALFDCHRMCLDYQACQHAFQALRTAAASHGLTWRAGSNWIRVVGRKLSSWGWHWHGPWTFQADDGSTISLTGDNEHQLLHKVRES